MESAQCHFRGPGETNSAPLQDWTSASPGTRDAGTPWRPTQALSGVPDRASPCHTHPQGVIRRHRGGNGAGSTEPTSPTPPQPAPSRLPSRASRLARVQGPTRPRMQHVPSVGSAGGSVGTPSGDGDPGTFMSLPLDPERRQLRGPSETGRSSAQPPAPDRTEVVVAPGSDEGGSGRTCGT